VASCEEVLEGTSADQLGKHLCLLKKQFMALEDAIYAEHLTRDSTTDRVMLKAPGSQILSLFAKGSHNGDGIKPDDMKRIGMVIRKAVAVLTFSMDTTQSGGLHLDKLQCLLAAMFRPLPAELDSNYRMMLYEDVDAKKGSKRKSVDFFSGAGPTGHREQVPRTLCLWCFSSSHALKQLEVQEIRSLIITSGTLSPIEGQIKSFGVPFPVVVQNTHVIDPKKQVWGNVLPVGPTNVPLNASYTMRDQPAYLKDLGCTVAHFASCVPDGVLLAFQSYSQKESVLKAWRQMGLWDEIQKAKQIFEEPKGHHDMLSVMNQYSDAVSRGPAAGRLVGGAILAAVCRGKLCEGIDFTDKQCRLVIMVGIPYPSKNDLKVLLKQDFLDQNGSGGDGRQWYENEAARAVNQTLGRVIRHRNDFGGVVLCDCRYSFDGRPSGITAKISSWLRPEIHVATSFDDSLAACRRFFANVSPQQMTATPKVGIFQKAPSTSVSPAQTATAPSSAPRTGASNQAPPTAASPSSPSRGSGLAPLVLTAHAQSRSPSTGVASAGSRAFMERWRGRKSKGCEAESQAVDVADGHVTAPGNHPEPVAVGCVGEAPVAPVRRPLFPGTGVAAQVVRQTPAISFFKLGRAGAAGPAQSQGSRGPATPQTAPDQSKRFEQSGLGTLPVLGSATLQASTPREAAQVTTAVPREPAPGSRASSLNAKAARPGSATSQQKCTKDWLDKAKPLLPRMEFDLVQEKLSEMWTREGDLSGPGAEESAGASVEAELFAAMHAVGDAMLPEFNFDTPEEAQMRETLVRDCGQCLPRLLRPLWKGCVEELFQNRGTECHIWASGTRGNGIR